MKKLMMAAMVAATMVGAAQADEPDYLTFTAEAVDSSVTFKWLSGNDVMINTNGTWVAYTAGTTIPLAKIGDKVKFKGNGVTTGIDENYEKYCFSMTGKIAASGDVGTLTDGKGGADVTLSKECYKCMFVSCRSLTSAPKLPATNLTESCYQGMLSACSSLTAAPELPATNLTKRCYYEMLANCLSLTAAPTLPATNLAPECYRDMFNGCTSLTTAPTLPATTLADGCYTSMFQWCWSLTAAPELPATNLAPRCYSYMFYSCTALKVNTAQPGKAWSIPAEAAGSAVSAQDWNKDMFAGTPGTFTGGPTCGMTYYVASAPVEFRVTQPEHATFQAYTNGAPVSVPFTGDYLTDFTVTYTAADNYMFPGGYRTLTTNVTASAATVTVTLTDEQQPVDALANPNCLTFSSKGAFKVMLKNGNQYGKQAPAVNLECSTDKTYWSTYNRDQDYSAAQVGGEYVLYLRGTNNTAFANGDGEKQANHFVLTGDDGVACSGNIETLLDYKVVEKGNHPKMDKYAFAVMFLYCASLTTAPTLPATNLTESCYAYMFSNCTSLKEAPALLAETLATSCYKYMFKMCFSLTAAPELSATTLADSCYYGMLSSCSSLTNAPALPVMTLMNKCYDSMFSGCKSLKTAPELPAKELTENCYNYMFCNCSLLTEAPELPATNLATSCYTYMFDGCTSLIVNTNAPGKAWSIPAEAKASAASAQDWNKMMFRGTPGDITNTTVTCGVTYYVRSAWKPVTVELPEVAGATAQLYTFYTQGGWKATATNEVPSNATVRVVWTVTEDGKALSGEGAVSAFQWQTEFVASNSVQTAPQPIVGEAGESEITLNIDTRTVKKYFEKADILPVWYAAGEEVKVKGEGEQSWETLVKSSATTNTFAWVPAEQGTYNFSQNGFDAAQIIYTTPVEVTTNDLEVSGTMVAVTADGSPIEPQTEGTYAGKLMVASNSTVTATWTATGSGVYFMDGTTTYTQTFEAGQSVNPVSEAVTKPETPKAPKLKLGVVAQRYPWDGKIDVQYWAQNTPNTGYEITITVTLPDGTTASETKPCLNGKNVTDFDARAAFGEVQFPKGVKIKATLSKAE